MINKNSTITNNAYTNVKQNKQPTENKTIKETDTKLSKVEIIKKQIAEGSYKIDLNKLANKMANDLL